MFARFLLVTVLLLSVVTSTRYVLAKKPTPQTSAEVLALTHANVIDGVNRPEAVLYRNLSPLIVRQTRWQLH